MASKRSIEIFIRDPGWTKILDVQKWHYRYGKEYLYCYTPNGRMIKILKSDILPLKGNRLSKHDAIFTIDLTIIHKAMEKAREKELPKVIQELQNLCMKTITNWNWTYPWNHPCQPKHLKDTLVIMGDGFIECRFDYINDNAFKVVEKKPRQFMDDRSKLWKRLRTGQVLTLERMRNLSKALV